jgi:hypothetical protein
MRRHGLRNYNFIEEVCVSISWIFELKRVKWISDQNFQNKLILSAENKMNTLFLPFM